MLKIPEKSYLQTCIEEINAQFKEFFLQNSLYENPKVNLQGIAKQVQTSTGEIIPSLYNYSLKRYENVVFNDKNPIQWYFRVLPSTAKIENDTKYVMQSHSLAMIIYTKFEQNNLVEFILKKLPYLLQFQNTSAKAVFLPNSYSFEYLSIFRQERGSTNFNINNEWNLIEIRLKCEISHRKDC